MTIEEKALIKAFGTATARQIEFHTENIEDLWR
jgi:hypothetical protein